MFQITDRRSPRSKARRVVGSSLAAIALAPFLAALASQQPALAVISRQALLAAPKVAIGVAPSIPLNDIALGAVPAGTTERAAIVLYPRDTSTLTDFIAGVTNKDSQSYHRYLNRGSFASRFGPARATIVNVENALRAEGLDVEGVSSDGLLVTFHASAGGVERAFGVGLERYRLVDGTIGQATVGAPRLPRPIAASVAGIVGLDDLAVEQPQDITPAGTAMQHGYSAAHAAPVPNVAGAPAACPLAQQDATSSGGLTDAQIANSYGAFGLYQAGDFAAGQHIAVFEQQPFLATDIETFDTCYFGAAKAAQMSGTNGDLTGSLLSVIPVDGGELQPGPGSANDEATLDVEDVSALASGANIDVYEAPNTTFGTLDEYTTIVDDDTDQTVTSSWAVCEQLAQVAEPGLQQAENFLFEQAAAQGQTVLGAAGDTGNDSCNSYREVEPPSGQNLLSELDPGSQPYVLSVGGTTIDDATQPPAERVWNDGAEWGGGGGGPSETWAMPSWQRPDVLTSANAADMSNADAFETAQAGYESPFGTPTFCDGSPGADLGSGVPCREVPDVSAQADEFTGSITIYGASLGYGQPDGWATIGGTSSATPIWASMLALVNASSFCSGETINGVADVGFAAPVLYGIAANASAYAASFNDIMSGNNDDFGLANGALFAARAGYDMASGLGSPQLTTAAGGYGLGYYMCRYAAQLSPPSVTSLSPVFGSTVGGYVVQVTGTGFGTSTAPDVASVSVGGAPATSFTVVDNTTLSVTVPNADLTTPAASPNPTEDGAGPDQIVVTNTSGQSSVPSASSLFEYVDQTTGPTNVPSVTSLSPYGGLATDPATVTIFGSGFAAGATVDFGGVAAGNVTVVSPFEITASPPPFSSLTPSTACPTDNGAPGDSLNAADDICQVEVTVTLAGRTSATAAILPPYEGPLEFDNMGAEVLPSGCGCEDEPQTTEYDYVPQPTVTSVSTGTDADLPANAADLASEFGGALSNTVTVTGTGLDPLTLQYALLGLPLSENSIFYPEQESGTSMVLLAPALLAGGQQPTTEPVDVPVGAASLAGTTAASGQIVYAGVPDVTSVVNATTGKPGVAAVQSCPTPAPASGCGQPLAVTGQGLLQTVGPIGMVDAISGFDLATQYNYTINDDTSISMQSLMQNPALVVVEACSASGCGFDPAASLVVYPPGNPVITSLSLSSGPAHGGNRLTITGQNLGCAVSVSFGTVVTAEALSNEQALLDCGQTGAVTVSVPPGAAGSTVPVTIETLESYFTGSSSNSKPYLYTKSSPSAPRALKVDPGKASAKVTWAAPQSTGGDPVSAYVVSASSPGLATQHEKVASTATSCVFRYLQPGVPITFSIVALSARGVGLSAASTALTLSPGDNGYILATAGGGTFGFGSLSSHGGPGGVKLAAPIVAMATTPDGLGYFELASNGAVYNFGDAGDYGSASVPDHQHAVGIAATADGEGYWVLLNTGRVERFGDAQRHGSVSAVTDAVAISATPDGGGYYVAQANGTVSAFGDAILKGDEAGKKLAKPIVGIAVDEVATGYWLLGGNGAIYNFGAAHNYGSETTRHLTEGASAIAGTPDGKGYWILAPDAKVFNFGSAKAAGDGAGSALSRAVGIIAG